MSHDSQPEGTPGDAPRPLSQLRARLADDARRSGGASLGERMRVEAESAMEWQAASGGGQSYSEDSLGEGRMIAEGNEHRIFQTEDGRRAIKLTRPPNYGARGGLADYLDNLVLNNYLWGDDLRVEGIRRIAAGLQLIISQPWIAGTPARYDEIRQEMTGRGFAEVKPEHFHDPVKGIGVMDARTANIFKDSATGLLIPIDVHISAPAVVIAFAWEEQRRREQS